METYSEVQSHPPCGGRVGRSSLSCVQRMRWYKPRVHELVSLDWPRKRHIVNTGLDFGLALLIFLCFLHVFSGFCKL